jgi:hypothetical protein
MSTPTKRDEWDRHNRDEATARDAQQEAAGPTHRPVPAEPYASPNVQPAAPDARLDVATLIQDYERATMAERVAWLATRDRMADESGIEAWNAWRDAVERTQRAARRLVDHGTGADDRA